MYIQELFCYLSLTCIHLCMENVTIFNDTLYIYTYTYYTLEKLRILLFWFSCSICNPKKNKNYLSFKLFKDIYYIKKITTS